MRLLVVEDDPDLRRQLVAALQDAGYAVDAAKDGEEGHSSATPSPMTRWCWTSACRFSTA